jgi:signal transduction histidine kinase
MAELPDRCKVLMIDDDPSRRKVLHQRTKNDQIETEKMAAIGRMTCAISHDLRHSLSTIYANIEFLERPELSSFERAELLVEVQQSVQVMTEILDSLLQFGSTGQTNPLVHESVSSIVESAIASVRNHPDGRNVSIVFATSSNAEADIDARKLESAIYNLLLNACQAVIVSPFRPEVNVYIEEVDEWIYITVVDNGPGVPSSIRKTLFDPFVTSGKRNGTGLGLTLVRRIAQEHGGDIRLEESNRGRTAFTFSMAKNRLQM